MIVIRARLYGEITERWGGGWGGAQADASSRLRATHVPYGKNRTFARSVLIDHCCTATGICTLSNISVSAYEYIGI